MALLSLGMLAGGRVVVEFGTIRSSKMVQCYLSRPTRRCCTSVSSGEGNYRLIQSSYIPEPLEAVRESQHTLLACGTCKETFVIRDGRPDCRP